LEGGPPIFRQDFTCPALLEDASSRLPVRGCHPLWPAFPDGSGPAARATGLVRVRSPLLAESQLMSFPPATEMFQFAGFAPPPYRFRRQRPIGPGCPIRRSMDQRLLAPPHGFSQRATSFIASRCRGIHQMPLGACSISRRDKPRQGFGPNTRSSAKTPLERRAPEARHRGSGIRSRSSLRSPIPRLLDPDPKDPRLGQSRPSQCQSAQCQASGSDPQDPIPSPPSIAYAKSRTLSPASDIRCRFLGLAPHARCPTSWCPPIWCPPIWWR
jgi:hypothetical protein